MKYNTIREVSNRKEKRWTKEKVIPLIPDALGARKAHRDDERRKKETFCFLLEKAFTEIQTNLEIKKGTRKYVYFAHII